MTYIAGHDRSQLLLLPEAVDDYVGSDNPVRFIDAFVDGLDLAVAGFGGVTPKVTGRPAYAPGDLLKQDCQEFRAEVGHDRRKGATMSRRKDPRIPNAVLDQLLAGADPKTVFDRYC